MRRFPYVQQLRRKGRLYLRFRRKGYPSAMLAGPVGSPQFIQAYAAALIQPVTIPQQQPKPAPVPKENASGRWVYIIGYGESGLVKIGTTTRPKQRIANLRATASMELW